MDSWTVLGQAFSISPEDISGKWGFWEQNSSEMRYIWSQEFFAFVVFLEEVKYLMILLPFTSCCSIPETSISHYYSLIIWFSVSKINKAFKNIYLVSCILHLDRGMCPSFQFSVKPAFQDRKRSQFQISPLPHSMHSYDGNLLKVHLSDPSVVTDLIVYSRYR